MDICIEFQLKINVESKLFNKGKVKLTHPNHILCSRVLTYLNYPLLPKLWWRLNIKAERRRRSQLLYHGKVIYKHTPRHPYKPPALLTILRKLTHHHQCKQLWS